MKDFERLKSEVNREIGQLKKAEDESLSWLAYSRYLGTLGLLIVVPIVAGAYLGVWLDRRFASYGWTVSMIAAGAVAGALNAYLYLKGKA